MSVWIRIVKRRFLELILLNYPESVKRHYLGGQGSPFSPREGYLDPSCETVIRKATPTNNSGVSFRRLIERARFYGASLSHGVPGRPVPVRLARSGRAAPDSRPAWV